jgi:hypothetical protein
MPLASQWRCRAARARARAGARACRREAEWSGESPTSAWASGLPSLPRARRPQSPSYAPCPGVRGFRSFWTREARGKLVPRRPRPRLPPAERDLERPEAGAWEQGAPLPRSLPPLFLALSPPPFPSVLVQRARGVQSACDARGPQRETGRGHKREGESSSREESAAPPSCHAARQPSRSPLLLRHPQPNTHNHKTQTEASAPAQQTGRHHAADGSHRGGGSVRCSGRGATPSVVVGPARARGEPAERQRPRRQQHLRRRQRQRQQRARRRPQDRQGAQHGP